MRKKKKKKNLNFLKREEFSIQYREKQLNPKVTIEGQILFDSLSKILPCFWSSEGSIMVMDTIEIKSPYDLKSISGEPEISLQRVLKITEGELKKIKK